MLLITRQEGQSLFICPADHADLNMTLGEFFTAGEIVISIKNVTGKLVSIGLEGPNQLLVLREEFVD